MAQKRRTHGSGSIRELRPGVFRITAEGPADPVTGRRRQPSRIVKGTKADAQRELTKLKATIDEGPAATSVEVSMLVERFMRERAAGKKALRRNTRKAWEIAIRDVILPHIGSEPVNKITTTRITRLWEKLEDDGVSPHKLKRSYTILKLSFDLGYRLGWVPANPVSKVTPTPPAKTSKPMAMDPEVARALLAKVESDVELYAWLRVASATGARRGEVIALRWSDIDTVSGTVTIDEGVTIADVDVEVGPTKTGDVRVVQVDARDLAAIEALRVKRVRDLAVAGAELAPTAFLFCRDLEGRRPWRPDTTSDRYAKLRALVPGAEGTTLHTLRHNVASYLLAEGYDVETVAQRLGHRSTRMTLDVYGAALKSRAKEAGTTMGDLLG